MLSIRLNKEGEEIAAPSYYGYEHTSFENWRERHGYPGRSNDMGIMGGLPLEDDLEWDAQKAEYRKRQGYSALTDSTSMGKPLIIQPPKPTDRQLKIIKEATTVRNTERTHDQDGLNQFLTQMNRFTPGDFVTFGSYDSNGPMVTYSTLSYIISCDRLYEECVWADKESVPKPFLLLDLSPMIPNSEGKMSGRFANMLYMRHVTGDETTKFIRGNVQLQNYIQQAKAATKTGSLTIRP